MASDMDRGDRAYDAAQERAHDAKVGYHATCGSPVHALVKRGERTDICPECGEIGADEIVA